MKARRVILSVALGALVAAQFWPVDRTNPPPRGEPEAPAELIAVFRRGCYDCHSNETVWPWYSYIAPISWLLADHVEMGRAELNFSEWPSYPVRRKIKKREEILKEVEEGNMPPTFYGLLHPHASLTDEELAALKIWSRD